MLPAGGKFVVAVSLNKMNRHHINTLPQITFTRFRITVITLVIFFGVLPWIYIPLSHCVAEGYYSLQVSMSAEAKVQKIQTSFT